jgi:hypothetical protein
MIDLIILNLYGTIVPVEGKLVLRKGFESFLERYKDRKIVISARKLTEYAQSDLRSLGLLDRVKLYGLEDMLNIVTRDFIPPEYDTVQKEAEYAGKVVTGEIRPKYYMSEPWLRNIVRENKSSKENSVIISDHLFDVDAAEFENFKIIHTPSFIDENDTFSFDKISINSLKYRGLWFFQSFLARSHEIEIK